MNPEEIQAAIDGYYPVLIKDCSKQRQRKSKNLWTKDEKFFIRLKDKWVELNELE